MICFNWLNALRYLWPRGPSLGLSVCGLYNERRLSGLQLLLLLPPPHRLRLFFFFFLRFPFSFPAFSARFLFAFLAFLGHHRLSSFLSLHAFFASDERSLSLPWPSPSRPSPLRPWPLRLSRNRTIVHSRLAHERLKADSLLAHTHIHTYVYRENRRRFINIESRQVDLYYREWFTSDSGRALSSPLCHRTATYLPKSSLLTPPSARK